MRIYENGIYRNMTAEEVAAIQDAATRAEANEKRRPLSLGEVQEMMVRAQINTLTVDDNTALRMMAFYPKWATDTAYTAGYKVQRGGKLWRCKQAHTAIATWKPENAASLWEVINETHDGTKYDPIPYDGNMELEAGKYYSQSAKTYLCTRDTGNPVYHALAELVGLYVTEVTT